MFFPCPRQHVLKQFIRSKTRDQTIRTQDEPYPRRIISSHLFGITRILLNTFLSIATQLIFFGLYFVPLFFAFSFPQVMSSVFNRFCTLFSHENFGLTLGILTSLSVYYNGVVAGLFLAILGHVQSILIWLAYSMLRTVLSSLFWKALICRHCIIVNIHNWE